MRPSVSDLTTLKTMFGYLTTIAITTATDHKQTVCLGQYADTVQLYDWFFGCLLLICKE